MIYDNKTVFPQNTLCLSLHDSIKPMEVKQHDTEKNGNFYIEENGKTLAIMTYVYAGDHKFIIDHTQVNEGGEGKGLGKQLVNAAVEFARKKGYTILPLCPFAKSLFDKIPEWADVLAK